MMRYQLAALLCSHCGRDYAREYWAMAEAADPNVCTSCRRDCNPDAADAPRGGPPQGVLEQARHAVVSASRKQCRGCGGEWDGLILGPPPGQGSPLPLGICPACGAADDARFAHMTARVVPLGMPLPALKRPQRVGTAHD